jgi:hypothetical protein
MVDYNVAIPGGGSNALSPMALMAMQQRGQLGEGNLAYKEQLLALKEQQINNQLAKTALSQENTAAAKKDITNAISNSVVGLPGEAAGPYLPNVNRAVNSLALGGKLGPAKTVSDFLEQQAKQRVQEGLADENAAKAKGENEKLIDTHIARFQTMSQFVDSPEKAAAFSKAMSSDPALADYAHLAGDPEEAAARNAALYTQDPVAWHTGIAKLTGDQFISAIKPNIQTVGAGQNVVAISPSGTSATSLMTTPAAAGAPSTLAKLISERDALPPDDPRREIYAAMIKKETTANGQTINVGDQTSEFVKGLGKGQSAEVLDTQKAAKGAANQLDTIAEGEKLLNSGMYTGTGATFQTSIGQALQKLGFTAKDDAASNAQTYGAIMGKQVGEMVKQFGSGTSISDGDRIYAERMAAGDINLDEQALRKILRINKEASLKLIRSHNKSVIGIKSDRPLTVPVPASAAPPAEAIAVLKAKSNDPAVKKQFDQWYGEGAAEDILGQ